MWVTIRIQPAKFSDEKVDFAYLIPFHIVEKMDNLYSPIGERHHTDWPETVSQGDFHMYALANTIKTKSYGMKDYF